MKTKPIPDGFHTVTPYLMVERAAEYLEFLEKAFGAAVTERVLGPGGSVGHAQVKIGDSFIMLGEANSMWKAQPASLYLYVENADESYQRAVAAGATSIMDVTNMFYGDRHGGVKDAWGITWWIATHLEDVPQNEIQRRADEMMKKSRRQVMEAVTFHVEFSTPIGSCSMSWIGGLGEQYRLTRFLLPEMTPDSGRVFFECPSGIAIIIRRVRNHLEGRFDPFTDVRLDWSRVTAFQREVYLKTQTVKAGHTTTYGEISRQLGLGREGARAVGVALGTNPWPLIVPCHRVVAADGKMTGFSAPGGIRTKTRLLAIEGAELLSE